VRDFPTAKRLGARWLHFTGASVHERRGRVDFSALDYEIASARRQGLGVLLTLGGVRSACSLRPVPRDVSTCPPRTAADRRAYARYVRTIVRRYRGKVRFWEAWNEPNHASFWAPRPDPVAYAALLETEYAALHGADSRGRLIFGGSGGTELPFVARTLRALRGRRAFDLAGAHPYRYPPLAPGALNGALLPDGSSTRLTWKGELLATERLFSAQGYGRPRMWLTELGWPGSRHGNSPYHLSYDQQASYLRAAYALLLHDRELGFVQAAFWFNLRDYDPSLPNPDPEFFGHYGLIENGFREKPAAAAFRTLARGGASVAR
jgi:hypothetical protein